MLKRRKAYNAGPRWSEADEALLIRHLRELGFDRKRLAALFPNRTLPAIRAKARKLRINLDFFGESYRKEKIKFTSKIARATNAKIVFDAYAGTGHQTFNWIKTANKVFASEKAKDKFIQFSKSARENGFLKSRKVEGDWHLFHKGKKKIFVFVGDAIDAAAELKANGVSIDLIDLDTCGSTIPTLPTFLLLLKPKHLVITHGEFHSLRFKRQDVLRRLLGHRDVAKNPMPLSVNQLARELDKAVKLAALRAHNETKDSFWLKFRTETWLGGKAQGMLRRHYQVTRPRATADSLNALDN